MAVDQHEAMTRACLKDVFNRRDLSSLDKYMSAGEFFPNWPKKTNLSAFSRMYPTPRELTDPDCGGGMGVSSLCFEQPA
jgi:hypothetical protein